MTDYADQPCVMGVDVGGLLHVVIREHVLYAIGKDRIRRQPKPSRLWYAAAIGWRDLEPLVTLFHVTCVVIDAQPEQKLARDFVVTHRPRAWLARYDRHNGVLFEKEPAKRRDEPQILHIDRLSALDEMVQRFRDRLVELPLNARELGGAVRRGEGEYYRQLQAPQRLLDKDAQGNVVWRWQDNGKDDHYAHAELYCMLAGMVATSGRTQVGVRLW